MIKDYFIDYPDDAIKRLEELKSLIHDVASKTKGVGPLKEEIKWGELSFVTSETKSGSTIRIDWKKKDPLRYHIYFNCQTQLIPIFKEIYPDDFEYGGNRSISFSLKQRLPKRKIRKCIEIALTYNLNNYKDYFKGV